MPQFRHNPGPARPVGRAGRLLALASGCALAGLAQSAPAADCRATAAAQIDWQECGKSNVILRGSALAGANLVGTDFAYSDLRESDLTGANLEKATLTRASLAGSNAEKAKFPRVEGYRASFQGIAAGGANFASAELQRADFSDAKLDSSDFEKAELGRANFTNAAITGTKFTSANLARADLHAAQFSGPIDFAGAFLFMTRIEGLDLSAATGLKQWQIDQSCGDANTKLPADLKPPAGWPCPPPEAPEQ